ncbi:MAG TPA: hypothetical protein VFF26_13830 [Gallionella sp.]|nr:hypothetical protein [Gallionella sp.]
MSKKNIGSDFDDFLSENALLDENDTSLTLTTLASAAAVLGKKLKVELLAA